MAPPKGLPLALRPALRSQLFMILGFLLCMGLALRARVAMLLWPEGMDAVAAQVAQYFVYVPLFAALLMLLSILYRHFSMSYWADTLKAEERIGVFSRDVNTIPLEDVSHVALRQSAWARLLGYGTVGLSTAAGGHMEVVFRHIPHPLHVKRIL